MLMFLTSVIIIGSSNQRCLELPVTVGCTVIPSPLNDSFAAIVFYPLGSIPTFIALRAVLRNVRGTLVTLSLAAPAIIFAVRFVIRFGDPLSVILLLTYPAIWIMLLIVMFSSIRVYRITKNRSQDDAFLSRKVVFRAIVILLLYCSIYYEYYDYVNNL
jgi:energy-converting hydrogenase Eha subunit E